MRSREVIRFNVEVMQFKVSALQLRRQSSHAPVQVWNCSLMGHSRVAHKSAVLTYFAAEAWNCATSHGLTRNRTRDLHVERKGPTFWTTSQILHHFVMSGCF